MKATSTPNDQAFLAKRGCRFSKVSWNGNAAAFAAGILFFEIANFLISLGACWAEHDWYISLKADSRETHKREKTWKRKFVEMLEYLLF